MIGVKKKEGGRKEMAGARKTRTVLFRHMGYAEGGGKARSLERPRRGTRKERKKTMEGREASAEKVSGMRTKG